MDNSVNARFLAEAEEMEKRWDKTGLLNPLVSDIPDHYIRNTTAILMESQRLSNEWHSATPIDPEKGKIIYGKVK